MPLVRVAPTSSSAQLAIGGDCDVLWTNRKHFKAVLLLKGIAICKLTSYVSTNVMY